jgi:hypothetical protein
MIGSHRRYRERLATLTVLLSFTAPVWSPQTARADAASPPSDAAYQENIARGLQEFDLEHWQEARSFFGEAHALQPSARTLRGLALTSYELRDYVAAVRFGNEAQASEVRPLTEDMRSELQRILRQARHFVGCLRVRTLPATASAWIDGKPAVSESDGCVLLNPGPHEVVARAPGFDAAKQSVLAAGGDELEVELSLRTSQPAATPGAATEAPTRSAAGPLIVLGSAAAVAAAGIVMVSLAASDLARVENAPDGATWSEYADANARAPKLSAAGFALIGLGTLGLAGGLAWKFWPRTADRSGHAALQLTPVGLRLRGRF